MDPHSHGILVLFNIVMMCVPASSSSRFWYDPDEVVLLTAETQMKLLNEAIAECETRMQNEPYPDTSDGQLYCNRTWDGIMCWPDTPADMVAEQPCALYINKFKPAAKASRACMPDGTWYVHETKNKTWTNYESCVSHSRMLPPFVEGHLRSIQLMATIGYALSLLSLVTAMITMIYFRKLHCPRNYIHLNLFSSFVLRALLSLLRDHLLVDGIGLPSDVIQDEHSILFKKEGTHWQCKLFFSLFEYALGANYMWILVEGMYLHMLIFVTVFSERTAVWGYIAFGWASPLTFVVPWIIVRATLEDRLCWNVHHTRAYFWIIRGPIAASNLLNFFFFLNIVRVLFTKLRASNTPEARKYRYRKLAKSTLVLIPLFGVHYILFVGFLDEQGDYIELAKLYIEMFFNSFQGFLVAMLFCFCNGEVQAEMKKKWQRFLMQRESSGRRSARGWQSVTTYVSRGRNSAHSIQSTYMDRGETVCMENGVGLNSSQRFRKKTNSGLSPCTPQNGKYNNNIRIEVTPSLSQESFENQSTLCENTVLTSCNENNDGVCQVEVRESGNDLAHLMLIPEKEFDVTMM